MERDGDVASRNSNAPLKDAEQFIMQRIIIPHQHKNSIWLQRSWGKSSRILTLSSRRSILGNPRANNQFRLEGEIPSSIKMLSLSCSRFLLIFYDFSRVDYGYVWMKIAISRFADSGLLTWNRMGESSTALRPKTQATVSFIAAIMEISLVVFSFSIRSNLITLHTISYESQPQGSKILLLAMIINNIFYDWENCSKANEHAHCELLAYEIYCFNIPTV